LSFTEPVDFLHLVNRVAETTFDRYHAGCE